jgi:hypothetical protein
VILNFHLIVLYKIPCDLSYIKHRVYLLWDSSLAGCVVVIYLFIYLFGGGGDHLVQHL